MSAMPAPGQGGPAAPGPRQVSFDPRPLLEPVDRGAARAFTQQLRTAYRLPGSSAVAALVVGLVALFFMLSFAVTGASVFLGIAGSSGAPWWFVAIGAVFAILFIGALVAGAVVLIIRVSKSGGVGDERRFRLDRFARANGMSYVPVFHRPALPGMIFPLGSDRYAIDLLRGTAPRFVEFANYRFTTSNGKSSTVNTWGYVAVKLHVPLPHIVLDALGNNTLGTNLPASFQRDQRLSLEGDFDRYFSLYCPAGYERDALYLFTPDIMARFIDNAAQLDVEIVDDWMFLYTRRDVSTLDPAMWGWLFSVVGALLEKISQWERWRDDRLAELGLPAGTAAAGGNGAAIAPALPFAAPAGMLRPPPGVAPPGRRLRRGVPWIVFIVLGIILLTWALPPLIGFFAVLFGGLFGSS